MEFLLDTLRGPCSCGKEHPLFVREVRLKKGALEELAAVLENCALHDPIAVYDENTYAAAQACATAASLAGFPAIILPAKGLHADEHGVAALEKALEGRSYDSLLAVGSGTIHDITRYVCGRQGTPFVSVPTAASVDGFVSTVAAMTMHGYKISFPSASPVAVVADTNLFAAAPTRLTAAGAADLLGKYTALADWRISHILTGEEICERIIALEEEALASLAGDAEGLAAGDPDACERLMHGLLLSGLAMQMTGSSRPASGAEHHLSHLWEMAVINKPTEAYHGEKVGVGVIETSRLYHRIGEIEDIAPYLQPYAPLQEAEVQEIFGAVTDSVMEQNEKDVLAAVTAQKLIENWASIRNEIARIPQAAALSVYLLKVGGCYTLSQIGVPQDILPVSLKWAPAVRNRLTLMRCMRLLRGFPQEDE